MTIAARRVAINTGGGDAPGLNAVIHDAVYAARGLGWLTGLGSILDAMRSPLPFGGQTFQLPSAPWS